MNIVEIKNPIYSAVFVNSDELKSKYTPIHSKQFYHHSTIEFRPKTIKDLPIGEEVDLKITGRLTTDNFDILLVENKFTDKKNPHITLSVSEGLTPAQSNKEIEEHYNKIQPLNDSVKGYVGFFDSFVHKEKITSNILKVSEIQILIGRKLHWWKDNVVYVHGIKYKKVFLRPEYKKN